VVAEKRQEQTDTPPMMENAWPTAPPVVTHMLRLLLVGDALLTYLKHRRRVT